MRFAGRPEVILHTKMDTHATLLEPSSAPNSQRGRLGHHRKSEDISVERFRVRLAARGHRELDVINGRERPFRSHASSIPPLEDVRVNLRRTASPTILAELGLNPSQLDSVRIEHVQVLPGS
jgi:hypothetical protein